MTKPIHLITPEILNLFVRALVNEVDYDIHKNYLCGEEDGLDHYPELVATAAEQLAAITAGQADPDFQATLGGGHALLIEYGDEEFLGRCQCGKRLGTLRPDQPINRFADGWERHVMTEVTV